jgi:hypothetical protein
MEFPVLAARIRVNGWLMNALPSPLVYGTNVPWFVPNFAQESRSITALKLSQGIFDKLAILFESH